MNGKTQRLLLASLMVALFAVWAVVVGAQPSANTPALATTITPVYGDEDAKPIAMLTIFDPWAMVLGADSPVFVLYETGQVIYSRVNNDNELEYWSVMLDEQEVEALDNVLQVDAISELDEYYDLALMTDQPSETFTVAGEFGGLKQVGVYGSLQHDEEVRAASPDALVEAFDLMTSYEHPDAELWLPEKFEVVIWPWDTSGAVDWPADFPQLDSPFAVERESVTSMYVDTSEYERFTALVEDAGAVRLDGETYAVSVRWPFPHEVVWPTAGPMSTAEPTDETK